MPASQQVCVERAARLELVDLASAPTARARSFTAQAAVIGVQPADLPELAARDRLAERPGPPRPNASLIVWASTRSRQSSASTMR